MGSGSHCRRPPLSPADPSLPPDVPPAGLDASADATSSSKIVIFISLPVVFLVLAAAAAAAFFVFKKKKKKQKKPPAKLERPAGLTQDQGSSFMSAEL